MTLSDLYNAWFDWWSDEVELRTKGDDLIHRFESWGEIPLDFYLSPVYAFGKDIVDDDVIIVELETEDVNYGHQYITQNL